MKYFTPDMMRAINAQTKIDEDEFVKHVRARGWDWEQLDLPTNTAKRPEGCILINGQRAVLAEVKRSVSGGRSTDGTALLTEFDPDLYDTGAKQFPGVPPGIGRHLDSAAAKHRDLVSERSEFADLPYVVTFFADPFVSLTLVDRRLPTLRMISGTVYMVRGRRNAEALAVLDDDEIERRIKAADYSGLPDPGEIEWRLVANPFANQELPAEFKDRCILGWPGDLPWPDSLGATDEARARRELAALSPDERTVLLETYPAAVPFDPDGVAVPIYSRLGAKGYLDAHDPTAPRLTRAGLVLGMVDQLDRLGRP
jgi:hypothetical protein